MFYHSFFQYITLFYLYFEFSIALCYVLGLTKISVKLMRWIHVKQNYAVRYLRLNGLIHA